jgi:ATP synthase F1 complex assembly factor 2
MKRIKRFYDTVAVGSVGENHFNLLLNNKSVKTPLGENLLFDSYGVAAAVATEWQLQTQFVVPNTMPINTIMMTHIDIDSKMERGEKLEQINRFIQTDTLRFPEVDGKSKLAVEQRHKWTPILNYLSTRGVKFTQSTNAIGLPQSTDTEIEIINQQLLGSYDSLKLSMLETAAKYLKSGTTGIGLIEGVITPQEAFEAAYIEELCQRKEWGLVEGDHDMNDAETLLWLNGISVLSELVR